MAVHALQNVVPMPQPRRANVLERFRVVDRDQASCSACGSLAFCMPTGERRDTAWNFDELVSHRVRLRKGEVLVRTGDRFAALYAIRSGSCKSVATTASGQQQIAGYHIAGDMLGAGAIFLSAHDATITALEDSEFCVIPFDRMEALGQQNDDFQHSLCALLSREIGRERRVMLMLGTMRAEQRLASFLLDLADRYHARGYSSSEFVLRMTREEIGSHLGLKLETVSRLFSRFHQDALIRVQGRDVKLLDRVALRQLVDASLQ